MEAELLAYESLISELGQALRALQPMDVLFNKWGGRFDVRWWMLNEGNDWRTPKLVRWRKQRNGGWFPCPIDRKPLVQHYNGIARAPEVAMMVIEARQRIEEYEVRRARYCELAASFRQRPEPETRSKAAELLALRARVEDFTARAVAEKAAEMAERNK